MLHATAVAAHRNRANGWVARTSEGILHTRSATDIVKAELSDTGVLLEQERKGLANATSSTENSNLGKLLGEKVMLVATPAQVA